MAALGYSYRRLVNLLGPERVARGAMERLVYSHDFAALPKPAYLNFGLVPDLVVLPKTTEEVRRIVQFSDESSLPIVPRGGGTGFTGGAVPARGGILIDFRLMRRVSKPDPQTRTIQAEAGATWKEVADAAARGGFYVPYQPNFAPSSTVGGWINSGGVGVGSLKYGSARENLLNLELVGEDGTVFRTGSDKLDLGTSFANLGPFVAGSEGTLFLVTRATLRVYPRPEEVRPLAYTFPGALKAREAIAALVASDVTPNHVALLDEEHLLFLKALDGRGPGRRAVLSVALDGPKDEVAEDEKAVDGMAAAAAGEKLPPEDARDWWDARFYQYPTRRLAGGLVVAEAILPTYRLGDALRGVRAISAKMKMQTATHVSLVDRGACLVRPYFLADESSPLLPLRLGFLKAFADLALDLRGHPLGSGLFLEFNLRKMHGFNARKMKYLKYALDPRLGINPGKTVEMWAKQDLPGLGPAKLPPEAVRLGLGALGAVKSVLPVHDDFTRRRLGGT